MHADLISTSLKLLCADEQGKGPSPTDLRRAVSTAYYALFHHISNACAELIVSADGNRLSRARTQVYRSIDHRQVMDACRRAKLPDVGFPQSIADYAAVVLNAYKSRCKADYDPTEDGDFSVPQVLHKIGEVEEAIKRFDAVDVEHRRAFAILVAIRLPQGDRA